MHGNLALLLCSVSEGLLDFIIQGRFRVSFFGMIPDTERTARMCMYIRLPGRERSHIRLSQSTGCLVLDFWKPQTVLCYLAPPFQYCETLPKPKAPNPRPHTPNPLAPNLNPTKTRARRASAAATAIAILVQLLLYCKYQAACAKNARERQPFCRGHLCLKGTT